jgi:hypothetical protein
LTRKVEDVRLAACDTAKIEEIETSTLLSIIPRIYAPH